MTLALDGFDVPCVLGDRPEEREREQRVRVDAVLEVADETACGTDDLRDAVDYAALAEKIRDALRGARCRLLERAAKLVADVCLADPRVAAVSATVAKGGAVPGLGSARVTVSVGRGP